MNLSEQHRTLRIAGIKFGRLLAICPVSKDRFGYWLWLCKCDCDKDVVKKGASLVNGTTRSCGCLHRELLAERNRYGRGRSNRRERGPSLKGNVSRTKMYMVWVQMKQRCLNPNNRQWSRYGGRGIKVCARWENDFNAFLSDMGEAPPGLSLDRFPDNNGNYEPSNCRWATKSQQARNTRRNRFLTYNGETFTLTEWAEKLGINPKHLHKRIHEVSHV